MERLKAKLFIKCKMDGKVKEKKVRRHAMGDQSLSSCEWIQGGGGERQARGAAAEVSSDQGDD